MTSIDEVIGFLKAAKIRGATRVAIDAGLMTGDRWPSECDLPPVESMEIIPDADNTGGWIVVMVPTDETQ